MIDLTTIEKAYNLISMIHRFSHKDEKLLSRYKKDLEEIIPLQEDQEVLFEAISKLSKQKRHSSQRVAYLWKEYRKIVAPAKTKTSNEKEIRRAAAAFLENRYRGYVVKEEFTAWQLPVRPDLIAVGEDKFNPLVSLEIKSDKDSFDRIYRQLSEYEKFSSSIYLALDEKHLVPFLNKYGNMFPYVGILVYTDGKLELYKDAYCTGLGSLFSIMWLSEMKLMIQPFRGRSKLPNKDTIGLTEVIHILYSAREIRELSQAIVLWRLRNQKDCSGCIYSGIDIAAYCIDMDRKQELFDILLDKSVWSGRNIDHKTFVSTAKSNVKINEISRGKEANQGLFEIHAIILKKQGN